jgi:uncharacterized membrane protein YfhO
MFYDAEVIEDDQLALQILTRNQFNFKYKVILKDSLSTNETAAIKNVADHDKVFSVEFIKYENDHVILSVDTKTAGVLVMSDVYAPGWQVQIDGEATKLHRANHAFRAVFVPYGKHTVTFSYEPLSFHWGSILSMFGLTILGIGLLICYKVSPGGVWSK